VPKEEHVGRGRVPNGDLLPGRGVAADVDQLAGAVRTGQHPRAPRSGWDGGAAAFLRGSASFANVIPLPGTITSDAIRIHGKEDQHA
jgi:hypothetical protein